MSEQSKKARHQAYFEILETAKKMGVQHPELFASQWALESDWGRSASGKYNYWGVKAGNGDPNNDSPGTVRWTKENLNGKTVRLLQKFRDYNSLEEAIRDRYAFTAKRGGRYDKAGYFTASSPAEAAMALQRANYATDPNYAKSLIDVMKGVGVDPYNGQQFDYRTSPPVNIANNPLPTIQGFTPPTQAVTSPAINVAEIAHNFGVPTEDFNPLGGMQYAEPEVVSSPQKYQAELAKAFGVEPSTQGAMPDYIGDLVRSIYDQA